MPQGDDLDEILGLTDGSNDTGDWTGARAVWTVSAIALAMTRAGVPTARSTVRGWCAEGILAAEKTSPNGHYRVRAVALRAFMQGDAALAAVAA